MPCARCAGARSSHGVSMVVTGDCESGRPLRVNAVMVTTLLGLTFTALLSIPSWKERFDE